MPGLPAGSQAELARVLLDSLLGHVMLNGIFHASPHPGNILLLNDGHLGLVIAAILAVRVLVQGTALKRIS